MDKQKQNLIDVSRLYTLRKYSEDFNIPYATVYGRFNTSLSGRSRNPFTIVEVSGMELIFVSIEDEKKLKEKSSSKK